ncbi:MAG: glycosyltransferase, partial [Chitinophagaceae bacterium]
GNWLIIAGKPIEKTVNTTTISSSITCLPHAEGNSLQNLLMNSKVVICRSGYTSLMELVALNKQAILIPTPGQTEQQYLAEKLCLEKQFAYINQAELTAEKLAVLFAGIHEFKPKHYPIFTDTPALYESIQ